MKSRSYYSVFAIILLCILKSAHSYNDTLGVNLCRLAVASYCNSKAVSSWSCGPCLNSPIKMNDVKEFYNSTGDTVGIIGVSDTPRAICKYQIKYRFSFQGNSTMGHQKLDIGYKVCQNKVLCLQ